MRLAVLAYPGALRMGVEGMRDILTLANDYGERPLFVVRVFTDPIKQRRALTRFLGAKRGTPPPTMVVVAPGRLDAIDELCAPSFGREVLRLHGQGHTMAAICTGNFALASAGLLRGREMTSHWGLEATFRQRFPEAHLRLERILIDHGDVVSVGGMTAFMDFCLWLIAREGGRGLALLVARILQISPERESQLPWMELAPPTHLDDDNLKRVVEALQRQPQRAWSVKDMARVAASSQKTLERRFRAALGTTPAHYLQEKRLEVARRHLEKGASVEEACAACGWTDLSSFVRLFRRRTGFTPARYRAWTRGEKRSTLPRRVTVTRAAGALDNEGAKSRN